MIEELTGQIERITYTNEENGYTIARVKVRGYRELVSVVGNLIAPTPGAILKMKGEWSSHPKYGEQFKVSEYKTAVPATVYGIKKYLGSGLIKGIGPVMAERIVSKFGKVTLDIIEKNIDRLTEVEGIGVKRIGMIKIAWDEQKEVREIMLFLQSHGISSGYATKIYKQYQSRSIEVVTENPYRLATDIFGIGFIIADKIAEKLGFDKNSNLRAEAGILYVLQKLSDDGHVYYPFEELLIKSHEILEVKRDILVTAISDLTLENRLVVEGINDAGPLPEPNNKAVYLAKYHLCETGISSKIKRLIAADKSIRKINHKKAVAWVQGELSIKLADKQRQAISCAINNKISVITGGPGTGKTTIINSVLRIFLKLNIRILFAAPTGRAAKRMNETTGHPAKTIHRLLEYSIQKGGFQKNEEKPLKCDLLVIDEASMIDTVLMYHLMKAVSPYTTLIFVGDVNQLPSVGAGNVLGDIINSGLVQVVELNEIFRQAKESMIIVNAHKINQGIIPHYDMSLGKTDFYFIEQQEPEDALNVILKLVHQRIPGRFGFDPINDIQVLTPMNKGIIGTLNLNKQLQEIMNPGKDGVIRGDRVFRQKDKVMQIRNNYDKDIYNGDIGFILKIDTENQEVTIRYDVRDIIYEYSELDEIVLAYAISVHKSQGSEYPVVIIPVMTQHYILLQRNLLYTGVTRGRKLVVLVGTKKAMAIAVNNNKTQQRYTYLSNRLQRI